MIEKNTKERKSITENEGLMYLAEVDTKCPLCGSYLLTKGVKKLNKEYQIAHIYPNSPTLFEQQLLNDAEKISDDSEDFRNKIALCKTCHWDYDQNKTVEKYEQLLRIKKQLLANHKSEIETSQCLIEDDIVLILNSLSIINDEDLQKIEKLSYDALEITSKLGDKYSTLRRDIQYSVMEYYTFIRQEFKNLDEAKRKRFDLIASEIKTAYLRCSVDNDDKEIVFKLLVEWLKSKTKGVESACKIVISFFVQNCEVYDKVTK